MTKNLLPQALSKLCSRVAIEQLKPQTWQRAGEMKAEFEARLAAGASPEAVESELMDRLRAAVVEQFRR